jgi:hypothetical protein
MTAAGAGTRKAFGPQAFAAQMVHPAMSKNGTMPNDQ